MNNAKDAQLKRYLKLFQLAVHIIILFIGGAFIVFCYIFTKPGEDFVRPLLINIGSSLVVVTALFSIFEFFRQKEVENFIGSDENVNQERAEVRRNQLIESQSTPDSDRRSGTSVGGQK